MTRLDPDRLAADYRRVRASTVALAAELSVEDQCIQSMPDASPTKWHLAHTSWFFETFVLATVAGYRPYRDEYAALFNSYYQVVGPIYPRSERGLISRPGVEEVLAYRTAVDERMLAHLERIDQPQQLDRIELGVQHEQQHQELILTDIKHALAGNPAWPAFRAGERERDRAHPGVATALGWVEDPGGLVEIGRDLPADRFGFDNEHPRHRVWLEPFSLATRLSTCGEYLEFVRDGGYRRPELWLSDGWDWVQTGRLSGPAYWAASGDGFDEFTLDGRRRLDSAAPVCHVGFYEADAFARWSGARLPTEAEWEHIAARLPVVGNLLPNDAAGLRGAALHPQATADAGPTPTQMFGDVWEWTASPYLGYPGFRPAAGAVGEYNGKFMINQMVLRGGSCATPSDHVRATYRNFFPPSARWQFSGIRLARDAR